MTQQQYIINRKMNILELGETLGNISLACRRLGVSRHNGHPAVRVLSEHTSEDGAAGRNGLYLLNMVNIN